jgi:SAM-dependent methyltransferase
VNCRARSAARVRQSARFAESATGAFVASAISSAYRSLDQTHRIASPFFIADALRDAARVVRHGFERSERAAGLLLYIAAQMNLYRNITGPPEEVMLPIITSSIRELLSVVAENQGSSLRALDVGCGDQPLKQTLRNQGYAYHSCDRRQNQAGSVDFVTPIDGTLPKDLVDVAPFSLLVCTEVLEHVFDWDAAFRNFTDLVGPGGHVLITCPFVYFPHERPYDFWRPTTHAIRSMADRHGFQIVRSVEAGSPWDVVRLILKSQLVMSLDSTASSRLAAFCARRASGLVQTLYESRWIRSRVTVSSEFYLNTAVLMRRGC